MATTVKPVIKSHEGPTYTVEVGAVVKYTATINFGNEKGGITPMNAKVTKGGKEEAHLAGVLRGGDEYGRIAAFEHITPGQISENSAPALKALLQGVEEVLVQRGDVEKIVCRAHPALAAFLTGEAGYSMVEHREGYDNAASRTAIDVEKNLKDPHAKLPDARDITT